MTISCVTLWQIDDLKVIGVLLLALSPLIFFKIFFGGEEMHLVDYFQKFSENFLKLYFYD